MDYSVYVPNREHFDRHPDSPQILPDARYLDLDADMAVLHGFKDSPVPR
jgi:hypothetical protein